MSSISLSNITTPSTGLSISGGIKNTNAPRALFLGPTSLSGNPNVNLSGTAGGVIQIPSSVWTAQSAATTNITLRAADSAVTITNSGNYTLSFGYYAGYASTSYWSSTLLGRNLGYNDHTGTGEAGHRMVIYTGPLLAGDAVIPVVQNRDPNSQNITIEPSCILTVVTHSLL